MGVRRCSFEMTVSELTSCLLRSCCSVVRLFKLLLLYKLRGKSRVSNWLLRQNVDRHATGIGVSSLCGYFGLTK